MDELNESVESRVWRWLGNLFPAYRRTGARVTYVSANFHEVHVKLGSNCLTKNHLGITWGGSLYGALDPIFGVMLYRILERRYAVVDSHAEIRFHRPVRSTMYARFVISREDSLGIASEIQSARKVARCYGVDLVDRYGVLHASCQKHVCILAGRV